MSRRNAVLPSPWTDLEPGASADLRVRLSERYSGAPVEAPLHVSRGPEPGPTVCVTAAVHGDEINGTGAIRHLIRDRAPKLTAGTLVLVPVVNMPGFERHTRYLPDRRDLNRCFPGKADGSLAARLAWSFFERIIRHCDWGIDLHTASVRRTNYPNVRADLNHDGLAGLARAFGAEVVVHGAGPRGSLRRAATRSGCPTLILEAGEVWKVEASVLEVAVRGVSNCLRYLGMVQGSPKPAASPVEIRVTRWVRAEEGGFLEFHVRPGERVAAGDAIATATDLLGETRSVMTAEETGVVLGMTTMPSVFPGDPVYHLGLIEPHEAKSSGNVEPDLTGVGSDLHVVEHDG